MNEATNTNTTSEYNDVLTFFRSNIDEFISDLTNHPAEFKEFINSELPSAQKTEFILKFLTNN
jgi:hypothetical protein